MYNWPFKVDEHNLGVGVDSQYPVILGVKPGLSAGYI